MSQSRLFRGGTLLHLAPPAVERADLRVRDGRIAEIGPALQPTDGELVVDLEGRWLMPGLVCGHHHLYSALACGMPLPSRPPASFTEMLQEVWWRLDRALDEDGVRVSGLVGGVDAIKRGVTTIIDHHASPAFIVGSLEALDESLDEVGVRRILCYEITDRGGPDEARAGIDAHRALLRAGGSAKRALLVGGHASFTMRDETLAAAAALAREHGVGLHIHVAEATDDRESTGEPLIDRFDRLQALLPGSLFAHCVHLSDEEMRRMGDAGVHATHQARSNMNNGVGHAAAQRYPVLDDGTGALLGTDGIGADMFAELQAAYFRGQEAGVPWGPAEFLKLLTTSAAYASSRLDEKLGVLAPGAAADLVVLDRCPGPPLRTENLAGAMVFRFSSQMVRDVYVGGEQVLEDRRATRLDEGKLNERAEDVSEGLWNRMRAQGAGA